MKKLIIFAGAMLLLAAGTVGFFANRPMSAQEALILRNVEAIAQGEVGGPNGGFSSRGNGIPTSGEHAELKLFKGNVCVSVQVFPSTGEAIAVGQAAYGFTYEVNSYMWYQYDCDRQNNENCVVCFRYRV